MLHCELPIRRLLYLFQETRGNIVGLGQLNNLKVEGRCVKAYAYIALYLKDEVRLSLKHRKIKQNGEKED